VTRTDARADTSRCRLAVRLGLKLSDEELGSCCGAAAGSRRAWAVAAKPAGTPLAPVII